MSSVRSIQRLEDASRVKEGQVIGDDSIYMREDLNRNLEFSYLPLNSVRFI